MTILSAVKLPTLSCYTLKLLERLPNLDATLIDLGQPMLERAASRVGQATTGRVTTVQGDIR